MKLYRISQDKNNGWDTFDSAVVAAEDEDIARFVHPNESWGGIRKEWDGVDGKWGAWCDVEHVQVEYIGEAKEGTERGVIVASYNAG